MKNYRLFWLLTAPLLTVPFSSGCMFLKAPEAQPTPTPVPAPKPPYFDPAAGQPRGLALNQAGAPNIPDAFIIPVGTGELTGDTVAIQSVKTVKVGKPPKDVPQIGPPDTVKLAGIVAPTDEPGLQGAKMAILNWTKGQQLNVDIDKVYPTNLDGLKVVQIFFKGGNGPYKDQALSLNRMLVRSGWAVVDLYSPTSFDTTQWLYDEAYARTHKLGFWAYGVAIQQRVPVKLKTPIGAKGLKPQVTIQRTSAVSTKTVASTTTTTTSTTTSSPGVPPATGTPPVAVTPPPAQ